MLQRLILFAAVLAAGCSRARTASPSVEVIAKNAAAETPQETDPAATPENVVSTVFGGQSNLDLVRSATTVAACRLSKDDPNAREPDLTDYLEGPIVAVSEAQAAR